METIKSLLHNNYARLAVGGAVVIITIPVIKRIFSGGRRKVDISKYPRDKVILFQIPRGPYAPSFSPFPLKLETYLRMADIPYQNEFSYQMSSKQKFPWMVYDGLEVADSHFCIRHLNRVRGVDLSSWLSDDQKAVARAFQMMAEDHLYWPFVLCRWWYGINEPTSRALVESALPGIPSRIITWMSKGLNKKAHAQGIGRHTKEEVMSLAEGDIRAISHFLGKKAFLMGDEPCEEDCAIFGMLGQLYWQLPGPLEELLKEECRNLVDYCERMKERFWPDWEDCITNGGTKKANN